MFDDCDETVVVVKVTPVPSSSGDDGVRSDGGLLFSGEEIPIAASFGCFGVEGDEFISCFCCVEVQILSHCSPSCLSLVGLLATTDTMPQGNRALPLLDSADTAPESI